MIRIKKRGWWTLLVLVAVLACAGTWASDPIRSVRDKSVVAKMTEKTKTVCVGRFLVDVPARAEVQLSHEMIGGFEIEAIAESEESFRRRITAREAELDALGPAPNAGGLVDAHEFRKDAISGRTFIYGRNRGYLMKGDQRIDDEYVSVESHAHLAGMSFRLSAKYAEEERANLAEALLVRLQLRGEDDVPNVPGFCIFRAIFVEPLPDQRAEHVALSVALPSHPELALVLSSQPGGRREQGLLDRVAQTDAEATADEIIRVSKLRSGKRTINGLPGEESLERVRELNFATTYGFQWESPGVENDPLQPFLSLELQSGLNPSPGGPPVDSTLHQDALLALWDAISATIRPHRPALNAATAPPGAAAPTPPRPAS